MIVPIILLLFALCSTYEYKCGGQDWRHQPRVYINEREVLAPTQHGFSLFVDSTDDVVSKKILESGSWETRLLTLIAAIVKPGDSTGLQVTMMGKIVGPKGSVIIFEPYSVSYKIVTKNMQINGVSSYSKIYKYGAGEKEETLTLWVDDVNTGGTSFTSDSNNRGQPEEVEVKPVDSVIGDKHIDFILIDVEMFELPAMNGMRNILKRSPALTLLLEWNYLNNPNRNESRTKELLDWLALEGFKWYRYLSQEPCKLGTLQLLSIEQVLLIREEDLLLIGREGETGKFK